MEAQPWERPCLCLLLVCPKQLHSRHSALGCWRNKACNLSQAPSNLPKSLIHYSATTIPPVPIALRFYGCFLVPSLGCGDSLSDHLAASSFAPCHPVLHGTVRCRASVYNPSVFSLVLKGHSGSGGRQTDSSTQLQHL